MIAKCKLTVNQFLGNSNNVRAALILGTLLIGALVGGAPNDHGG